jgi:3'-phosphoadenosine 5'-phosphosulfate (PAPS) 3'-phosphatase
MRGIVRNPIVSGPVFEPVINRAARDIDGLTITRKQHNDFVTEVDQACEQAIIDTLLIAYPDHGIYRSSLHIGVKTHGSICKRGHNTKLI